MRNVIVELKHVLGPEVFMDGSSTLELASRSNLGAPLHAITQPNILTVTSNPMDYGSRSAIKTNINNLVRAMPCIQGERPWIGQVARRPNTPMA